MVHTIYNFKIRGQFLFGNLKGVCSSYSYENPSFLILFMPVLISVIILAGSIFVMTLGFQKRFVNLDNWKLSNIQPCFIPVLPCEKLLCNKIWTCQKIEIIGCMYHIRSYNPSSYINISNNLLVPLIDAIDTQPRT
jgi:hypothetical protein